MSCDEINTEGIQPSISRLDSTEYTMSEEEQEKSEAFSDVQVVYNWVDITDNFNEAVSGNALSIS